MFKKLFGKKSLKSRDTPYTENKFSGKILGNSEYLYLNHKTMKKIISLTESDLTRIIKRVVNENIDMSLLDKVKEKTRPADLKILKMSIEKKMSNKEIADELNIPVANVYQKIKSAKERVKKASDIMDKNPPLSDKQLKMNKIEILDGDIRKLIKKYSKDLSKEDIHNVIRKIIN